MKQPSPEEARSLLRKYDRLVTNRSTWDVVWRELALYMRPTRSAIMLTRTPGAKQTERLFDGTAIKGSMDLASALAGSFTSSTFQWFALKMRLTELNDDYETQRWLEECARRIFLAFQQSNFDSESHEGYLDLVVFGTGNIFMEEKPTTRNGFQGFQFRAIAPGTYVNMEDAEGRVATNMRSMKMTLQAAASKFGLTKLSETKQRKLQTHPDDMMEIVHVCQPAGDIITPMLLPRAYTSLYLDKDDGTVLKQGGFHKNPFLTFRWTKASDEEYGRGQGHIALPDTRTLNKAIEDRFKAWAKANDPPMWELDDGVIGKVRLQPGSRNVVRQPDALGVIPQGAKFDVANFQEQQLKQAIKEYFFSDRLQIPNKQYMTAYEVQEQIEIMQRLLGPTLGRITFEFLDPLIDRGFDIMYRAGALPPAPAAVMEAVQRGEGEIDVRYESPLTRSQRTGDLVAVDRSIQSSTPFVNLNPEVMDNYDGDAIVRNNAEVAGVPTRLMRPMAAVQKLREARAQGQQQQQQAAQAEQQSKTIKNLVPAAQLLQGQESAGPVARPAPAGRVPPAAVQRQ